MLVVHGGNNSFPIQQYILLVYWYSIQKIFIDRGKCSYKYKLVSINSAKQILGNVIQNMPLLSRNLAYQSDETKEQAVLGYYLLITTIITVLDWWYKYLTTVLWNYILNPVVPSFVQ